ncbi:MAG: STAS domain-containing protein [Gammaproteobacteria bacterium]|nr:STAS domain-containing protein [Gammaproteobacteria bacterium]
MLKIAKAKEHDVVILVLEGEVDKVSSKRLAQHVRTEIVEHGERRFITDLSRLGNLSSNGLRLFLNIAKYLQNMEGEFAVCGPGEQIKEVFELAGLTRIIPMYSDCSKALDHLTHGH